jgi:hypothetical protein
MLHAKGFSPVWVRSWRRNALESLHRELHMLHAKGFSPVWVRAWTRKWLARLAR